MISSNFPNTEPSLNLDFANSKKLDPRITFTRASAATYYDGKTVAKAEENLLIRSQEFDNAVWAVAGSGITVTSNSEVAPDGSTTADKITTTVAGTGIRQYFSFLNGVTYTVSVYVKSISGDTDFVADLTNVQFSPVLTLTSDWQRFTWTVTASAARSWLDFQLVGTGVFAIWGAQLEQRSSVTAYTPTTTQPITNYIPVLLSAPTNVARFDHNPTTGESLGLLIEEQRANLILRSEEFDDAYWTKLNSTLTSNAVVAPDGTLTADFWSPSTGSFNTGSSRLIRNVTTASGSFTASAYVKFAGKQWVAFSAPESLTLSNHFCFFDVLNGVVGNVGASAQATMQSVGDGWYRVSVTSTSSSSLAQYFFITTTDANGSFSVTGDGRSGIYIWGAQLEAGAFPTSYIKTEASQVTRSADSATMTGANFSSWYRQGEGTFFVDAPFVTPVSLNSTVFCLDDSNVGGTINNALLLTAAHGSTGNRVRLIGYNTAATLVNDIYPSTTFINRQRVLYAVTYEPTGLSMSINGGTNLTSSTPLPFVADRLTLGGYKNSWSAGFRNGHIKRIAYWPKRLTNSQLQYLTAN